jgi:uncharacterized membrane protein YqgA involved in biofilm formation
VRGIGTVVNIGTVLLGTSVGLLLRKTLPQRVTAAVVSALGLFTIALGVSMTLRSERPVAILLGSITGVALGSGLQLQNRFDNWVKRTFGNTGDYLDGTALDADSPPGPLSNPLERAVVPVIVFCAGPMTLVGAIRDGAFADPQLLLTKATMDGFSSIAFATALGPAVYLSALLLGLLQGSLTVLAWLSGSLLSEGLMRETGAAGGLLVIAVGIDLLRLRKLPVIDYLPTLITTPLLLALLNFFGNVG